MTAVTKKNINAALKTAGHDAEIWRGEGYCYFYGPDADNLPQCSVYVPYLKDLTVAQWVEAFEHLKEAEGECYSPSHYIRKLSCLSRKP